MTVQSCNFGKIKSKTVNLGLIFLSFSEDNFFLSLKQCSQLLDFFRLTLSLGDNSCVSSEDIQERTVTSPEKLS